jgi:hypothetical protein
MHLKDIISTLMLSDFYFSLPLWERKQVVLRLWSLYGAQIPPLSVWPRHPINESQAPGQDWPKG